MQVQPEQARVESLDKPAGKAAQAEVKGWTEQAKVYGSDGSGCGGLAGER